MKYLLETAILFLVFLYSQCVYSQNSTLNYSNNNVDFGLTSTELLQKFTEYKIISESGEPPEIKVYFNKIEGIGEYGGNYYFETIFKFYNDKLFMMEITDRWSPAKYSNILKEIVNQFEIVKEENSYDDEVGGWINKELKKGLLKGNFTDCEEATFFKCYDTELMKEVRKKIPDYEKNN